MQLTATIPIVPSPSLIIQIERIHSYFKADTITAKCDRSKLYRVRSHCTNRNAPCVICAPAPCIICCTAQYWPVTAKSKSDVNS